VRPSPFHHRPRGDCAPTRRLLAALGFLCVACGGSPPGAVHGPWEAEHRKVADTAVVRTVSGSVWGDTMVLVPEVEIGELEGADPYLFGSPGGVEVDGEGRIFVADRQAAQVRVFSPDGSHLRTIGRRGEGPGEFSQPDLARVRPDGRLLVRDQGNARYTLFTPDGELVTSWPTSGGFFTNTPFFLDRDGNTYHPVLRNPGTPFGEWRHGLERFDPEGVVLDTLEVPSRGHETPQLEVRHEGGVGTRPLPFSPTEEWTMDGEGGFYFGVGTHYRIDHLRADGTVLRVERDVEAAPVLPGERVWMRDEATRIMRTQDPAWRWEGPDIPSSKPPFTRLQAGRDGTLWVQRGARAVEVENPEYDRDAPTPGSPTFWDTPLVFDVFDAQGRYLGPVRAPRRLQPRVQPVLTMERVWAVALHPELQHPQVVRFRLEPQGG
jgi:hypothetical protein